MKLRLTVFFIHSGNTVQDCSSRTLGTGRIPYGAIATRDHALDEPEAVSRIAMNAIRYNPPAWDYRVLRPLDDGA